MIESLTFHDVQDAEMPWVAQLDYFKNNPVTQFKPGLNIVFGPNGSGKSTILQLLGLSLAAVQGGTSVVTQSWVQDVLGFSGATLKLPCNVVHDGQPVMYFDARAQEGLIGGGFDDDFFSLGVANTMARGSTGQLGIRRMSRMLDVLLEKANTPEKGHKAAGSRAMKQKREEPAGFPAEIEWRLKRNSVNETWVNKLRVIEELLSAKCAVGPKTLLFDEPESGYSLPWQAGLWKNVFSKVDPEKFQVIVATHSPFALEIPGAHYIEMQPRYADECLLTLVEAVVAKAPWLLHPKAQ